MDLLLDTVDSVADFNLVKENAFGVIANVTLLNMLLLTLIKSKDKPFPKTKNEVREEYDYVIIGGGTAGSIMANRLSEMPCIKVLLLEAGGEAPFLTEIPAYARLLYATSNDWLYKTVPQKYSAFAQNDNQVFWNSGKGLGGGSLINAMLYVRGNHKNYDDWEAEGATGWSYNDVLPFFKKLEDNKNIEELDPGYHAVGGPVTFEKPNYTPEIKEPILQTMRNMSLDVIDVNGRRQKGIYDLQGNIRNGQRCSTAKAYLVPAEDRPNLDIINKAFVTKILIENKKAYGVEFDFQGKSHTVRAKKEVIVSSGSVRTAQILMLSGIGPKEHLEEMGIPVIKDLPVGKNLHDHPDAYIPYSISPTIMPVTTKIFNPLNILQYIANRSGPLTAPNQVTLLAFVDGVNKTEDFPEVELYFTEYSAVDARVNFNLKLEVYDKVFKPYLDRASYVCMVSHLQPKSRGEITLKSTDPYDPPNINPNYYKEEKDVLDMVKGVKMCNEIAKSKLMEGVEAKPYGTVFPGCEDVKDDEDKYSACVVRSLVLSAWHPVGTARMGQPDDPRSVVDPSLRVIGVSGLRVVNAAVMPIIPSANTNIPTMMVAEKAYDIMKNDITCDKKVPKRKHRRFRGRHSYFRKLPADCL